MQDIDTSATEMMRDFSLTNQEILGLVKFSDKDIIPGTESFISRLIGSISNIFQRFSNALHEQIYSWEALLTQNWKKYAVGLMGDSIETVNPYVKVNGCSIHDIEALELLQNGSKQLSPGYEGIIVPEKGVFDGKSYTHRQYPITDNAVIAYNHVAIMDYFEKGRNGDNAVFLLGSEKPLLIMDSEQFSESSSHLIKTPWKNKNKAMKTIIFDAKDPKDPTKTILNAGYQVDESGMVMIPMADFQTIIDLNSMQCSLLLNSYNVPIVTGKQIGRAHV